MSHMVQLGAWLSLKSPVFLAPLLLESSLPYHACDLLAVQFSVALLHLDKKTLFNEQIKVYSGFPHTPGRSCLSHLPSHSCQALCPGQRGLSLFPLGSVHAVFLIAIRDFGGGGVWGGEDYKHRNHILTAAFS